jgi:hypothetical protein
MDDIAYACMVIKDGNYYDYSEPYIRFNLPPHIPRTRLIVNTETIIFDLNYMLDISPQTLQEKLKLYLTFS